ncbi:MAG: peptidase [Pseudomonadota bacterium]
MTVQQDAIVAEARRWIGTPYVHQCSAFGAGTDCLGLLRGVWRAQFKTEPEEIPPYTFDWSEPQGEERLWNAALRHLISKPVLEEATGDVLLFRMRNGAVAKHLGIASDVSSAPKFVHAYTRFGVIESSLTQPWRRRIVARFKFPEKVN